VLPHEPIRRLEDDLWEVEGKLPSGDLTRRMVLLRLRDGRVVVHNAVSLEDELMAEIEAWGRPSFLVVPNSFHRIDAWAWTQRYPGIAVVAGATAKKKVEQAVTVAGGVDILPRDQGVEAEDMAGTRVGEMTFVHTSATSGRKSLVLNDTFWNEPHHKGLTGVVFRIMGSTGGPRISRLMKVAGMSDRKAARAQLLRLAAISGLARVIPAHGKLVEHDAGAILTQAVERYL
jgi:hypothetical protein